MREQLKLLAWWAAAIAAVYIMATSTSPVGFREAFHFEPSRGYER